MHFQCHWVELPFVQASISVGSLETPCPLLEAHLATSSIAHLCSPPNTFGLGNDPSLIHLRTVFGDFTHKYPMMSFIVMYICLTPFDSVVWQALLPFIVPQGPAMPLYSVKSVRPSQACCRTPLITDGSFKHLCKDS